MHLSLVCLLSNEASSDEGVGKGPYLERTLLGLPAADVALLLELHLMNTLDLVSHDQWPAEVALTYNWLSCLFLVSMAWDYPGSPRGACPLEP